MKTKVLILTHMIVIHVGSLCGQLAWVYDSYTYDSSTAMNHTSMLIVRIDFLRARQSYAYETEMPIFTYHSDARANHMQRIRTRTPIIRKRSTREAYAYN